MKKMLIVVAHPGDESKYMGGTIAKYTKKGWSVDVLCPAQKEVNTPPGGLEEDIYQKLIELVPDIVITFDTTGVNNDPDHVRMSFATTFAFQKYALWIDERLHGAGEAKLYYACLPETIVTFRKNKKVIPAESFGKPWKGVDDKRITTVINTGKKKQEFFILRMHGTREIFMGKHDRIATKL